MTFIVECCNRFFHCNQTCYCVGMVSVTSASCYQSMYITRLIPRNWPRQLTLSAMVDWSAIRDCDIF